VGPPRSHPCFFGQCDRILPARSQPRGRATSKNAAGSTTLNEIAWDYNGFNQPVSEYQEHSGAVNRTISLKVDHTYANGSATTIRPTGIKYPQVGPGSAPVIEWLYSSTMADAISRVLAIRQGTEILADWRYVGLGMMVGQTLPAAVGTALSYGTSSTTAANAYTGYDRFVRIVRWNYGLSLGDGRARYVDAAVTPLIR